MVMNSRSVAMASHISFKLMLFSIFVSEASDVELSNCVVVTAAL